VVFTGLNLRLFLNEKLCEPWGYIKMSENLPIAKDFSPQDLQLIKDTVAKGATDDPVAFIELGAVYTPLLNEGEWWRIFTAQFLHWGATHLAFNMLGLWLLGRTVEAMIGFTRYIALYLVCGAGGMLIAWGASLIGSDPHPVILVGASASVLGLVGAQAAISLLAYRHTGNPVAKAQLNSMSQIVFLQAVFDMMVPEVSSTAHIGGAAVGFCVTYGFVARALRKRGDEMR
jgi:rhomboid protease GluP